MNWGIEHIEGLSLLLVTGRMNSVPVIGLQGMLLA